MVMGKNKESKVKLRTLTDEQFVKAPQRIKAAHLQVRMGRFDIYSDEATKLIKEYPNYFIKAPLWPNNPVRVISMCVKYLYMRVSIGLRELFKK